MGTGALDRTKQMDYAGLEWKLDGIVVTPTTATATSNAATLTRWACQVTTPSLSTAAGSSQAETLTVPGVTATSQVLVTKAGGTNTRHNYQIEAVCTAGTVTVTIYNTEPTNALNGTIIFNLLVYA